MNLNIIETRMDKVISHFDEELLTIRAGRANPAILNKVNVEYYGASTPINQVGTISVPEARQILISPWDRSLLGAIEKAIQKAEIGINPVNDGSAIRLTFPELNEDRRKELCKQVRSIAEESKIAIRNIRRDSIDDVKSAQKANEVTEDELKSLEEKIQKITDKYVANVDSMSSAKEKEIMDI